MQEITDRTAALPTPRELALDAIRTIWEKGKKPKEVLDSVATGLGDRDRAFLMELVYGVIRYRDTLDWTLDHLLKNPARTGARTRNNLRLGAYQVLFLRVPERAAVHEAVQIEKKGGRPELVNAVLRNLLRNRERILDEREAMRERQILQYIAVLTSHPKWLTARWIDRFGPDEALALAEANNQIPPLTLRVNTLKAWRTGIINALAELGIEGEPTVHSPDGIRLKGFRVYRELRLLRESVLAQDEASQLITYLLDPRPGERILDACAAPGGKTTHIAQLMNDNGEIFAVDIDEQRTALIRENTARLGITSVRVVAGDVAALRDVKAFDRILLDAPCSATGVIRRNPDVKYRHNGPADLKRFGEKQIALLRSVSGLLRPGGILVYSVCSTEPEEGEEVIASFLKDSGDFYIIDTTVPFLEEFMNRGFFRTYPHRHDMDGFFGVRLCRRA